MIGAPGVAPAVGVLTFGSVLGLAGVVAVGVGGWVAAAAAWSPPGALACAAAGGGGRGAAAVCLGCESPVRAA